jgi:hypothetical protein
MTLLRTDIDIKLTCWEEESGIAGPTFEYVMGSTFVHGLAT